MSMNTTLLPRIAARVLNVPLMIQREKLDTILAVLSPRLGLAEPEGGNPFVDTTDKPFKRESRLEGGIAVIDVCGSLVHETNGAAPFSGLLPYQTVARDLGAAVADPAVQGILLRLDTPGGECAGAWDLADAISAAAQEKPLAAVACDLAASAGYLLAAAAPQLFVTQSALVGSIGVIMRHVDVTRANAEIGVKVTEIYAGARKADTSPHRPLDDEATAELRRTVESYYGLFVEKVAAARGLSSEAVRATEARVYRGEEAVAQGLADAVATEAGALAWLREQTAPGAAPPSKRKSSMTKQTAAAGAAATSATRANDPAAMDPEDETVQGQDPEDEEETVEGETDEEEQPEAEGDDDEPEDEEEMSAKLRRNIAAVTRRYPQSVAAIRRSGARAERKRLGALEALAQPGEEKLLAQCKAKGTSVEKAAMLFAEARQERKAARLQGRSADRVPPVDGAAPAQGPKAGARTLATAKADFEASAELQAEFRTLAAYEAFLKASASGQARILNKSAA